MLMSKIESEIIFFLDKDAFELLMIYESVFGLVSVFATYYDFELF